MKPHEIFRIRLREIRKQRGITQQEVSKPLGGGSTSINHIEQGRKRVSLDQACAIAEFFGLPLERFLRPPAELQDLEALAQVGLVDALAEEAAVSVAARRAAVGV